MVTIRTKWIDRYPATIFKIVIETGMAMSIVNLFLEHL